MNYLNPPGFLGTGASLLADITLLAYILLILPGMIAGFVFARAGKHRPHHRNIMISITFINWVFIVWLMLAAFTFDVTANIGSQPGNARYLFPAIHGAIGLVAQLLATYAVYRMIREDYQVSRAKQRGETQLSKYWFKSAKPVMRIVLLLWIVTTAIGVLNYLVRYDVVTIAAAPAPAPVATPEVQAPVATEAIETPVATSELSTEETEEATETEAVAAPAETTEAEGATLVAQALVATLETPEVIAPVSTEEATEATATSTRRPPARTPSRTPGPTPTSVPSGEPLVLLGGNDELGAFLVDPEGRTLYVYANDEPGWSNCVDECLNNWEVYAVDPDTPLVAGAGVLGYLGLTERADGTYQVTYDDKPLYYFSLDRNPGDAIGHGAGNVWSVVQIQF